MNINYISLDIEFIKDIGNCKIETGTIETKNNVISTTIIIISI